MNIQYSVANDIFDIFPDYCRGVIIANEINNQGSSQELVARLRTAENNLRARLKSETLLDEPRIASWRTAYSQLGFKPGKHRPSMEALVRRALKGDPIPSINTIVDLCNLTSLRNLVPVGAHAIDVVSEDIELRRASGEELFEAFGSDDIEHPLPGEVIFVEGDTVLTRRWTWRQAKHTLVTPETKALEVNIDALPPVKVQDVEQISDQVAELIMKYCGGQITVELLKEDNQTIQMK